MSRLAVIAPVAALALLTSAVVASPTAAADPLSVSLSGVKSGDTVAGRVAIEAKVRGAEVERVEFSLDGRRVHTEFYAPYCMVRDQGRCPGWDSRGVTDGRHTVTATAYDRAGRRATAEVKVTVRNRADEGDDDDGEDAAGRPRRGELKVMSYNINWGAPGGRRLDAIAKVIASSGADVAGLQQVRRFARAGKKGPYKCEDQPAKLQAALQRLTGQRWHWAYVPNTSFRQGRRACKAITSHPVQEGVAILSRYPIVSKDGYRLSYQRGLAKAVVDVPGAGRVTVYTVHLDTGSAGRRTTQARQVAGIVRGGGGETVFLTGDMNDQPGDAPIRVLTEVFKDSGGPPTRNSKIDYVMYRGDADLRSVRVIQNWTSDHRPIVARFSVD